MDQRVGLKYTGDFGVIWRTWSIYFELVNKGSNCTFKENLKP